MAQLEGHQADILAITAHPDDVELHIAGTVMKAIGQGHRVAICDLTAGERGSRGSRELRAKETAAANSILGIEEGFRWNLGIPDGNIALSQENILSVVRTIRHFRPQVILFPWEKDRHPDHEAAHRIVHHAYFDAGLVAVASQHEGIPQTPHRPARMFMFDHSWEGTPDIVVDVSPFIERKLDALAAYGSQFSIPGRTTEDPSYGPQTFISGNDFMEYYLARMRRLGFQIGVQYGEGFVSWGGPVKVDDLLATV
ncbi:MAG: bacillithiol biosynthesis deacetylase BshB1 [Chlorobi bacterium]|nr:MAG: lmbe family protein [Chlorobi bacterium OLB7]MBK8912177.1 bacillithiol biosynthesis deacetylase BshB1 [Chlorobiota bacterium]MBX7215896.1 bacillithiol biosynthesis deacetylase BshB1 [Candidatus Kapabacteria bacterium]